MTKHKKNAFIVALLVTMFALPGTGLSYPDRLTLPGYSCFVVNQNTNMQIAGGAYYNDLVVPAGATDTGILCPIPNTQTAYTSLIVRGSYLPTTCALIYGEGYGTPSPSAYSVYNATMRWNLWEPGHGDHTDAEWTSTAGNLPYLGGGLPAVVFCPDVPAGAHITSVRLYK